MTAKEKMKKLLEMVAEQENVRTDFAAKCMDKNNTMGMLIHNAEAGIYTRMRYTLEDMIYGKEHEDADKMEFNEAYVQMKRGAKIKLPEWEGYWFWSEEKQTIIMHCKNGVDMDIRETEDVGFTMDNICRCDWVEVKDGK